MAAPPSYEPATEATTLPLLNIAPKPQALDFQTGYLGVTKSTLAGDVQIKGDANSVSQYKAVELHFVGVERTKGRQGSEVELTAQRHVLWDISSPSTSNAEAPSSLPFDIELTPDLPHCVHTSHSSLEYTLIARMIPADPSQEPLEHTVPIHLTRYSPEGDRLSSHAEPLLAKDACNVSPTTFSLSHPIVAHVSIARTIYRRSEPIELRIRIPPPSSELVQDKGVRLRSVGASLVRTIRRQPVEDEQDWDDEEAEDGEGGEASYTVDAVLSRSGKGCRFSPSRDLFLRLWLQPAAPFDGPVPCETITQSTIVHDVSFRIFISFALSGKDGDRETVHLDRRILILPDHPSPPKTRRSEKQREAGCEEAEATAEHRPPAPRYVSDPALAEPSTSGSIAATSINTPMWWEGEEADEYDGYEEASAGAELVPGPPTIDEDSSPPSLEDSDAASDGTSVTTVQEGETLPPVSPAGDIEAPPEYAGEISGSSVQPPAYSAQTRADEVEVMQGLPRRQQHGIV